MTSLSTPESNPTPQNGAAPLGGTAPLDGDAGGGLTEQPCPSLGRETVAGIGIVGVFLAGFIGWAALAPLESAAIAPGVVSIDGYRKTVQHLEGGIVGEILVREGEQIAAGQVLIRLDDTTPRASLELLRGRWMVASALEARLQAERAGLAEIRFPASLLERRGDPKAREIVEGQTNVFEARREALTSQTAILNQRVAQYSEEIVGIEGQIQAETEQLALVREELGDVRKLYKKGFARKPKLLQLQRRAAEIEGSLNMRQAQIARVRQSIAESRMRAADLETSMRNQVVEELRKVQAELYDLNERVRAAKDVLARTDIRAPLAGTVVDLQVHTAGGVIAAGAPLLDIVPSAGRLVVEAQVRFTAFNQRHRAPAVGTLTLTSVSADLLIDQASGEKYYLARVELVETQAVSTGLDALYPGMQAEVMIVTGARSALDYLLAPLMKSFSRAFWES